MAQSFSTTSGNLIVPGAYPAFSVQQSNAGLATTGAVMIVGEADQGPDYSLETDIAQNGFGPDQLAAVLAKYAGGPIVDAFRAASAPSVDPQVQGAPARIYLVKTNASTRASASLARSGLTAYGTLADQSYGLLGNNFYFTCTDSVAEVAPTTGPATLIPTPSGATIGLRLNGGAVATLAVTALDKVDTTVGSVATSATGLNSLTSVLATGGVNRGVITGLTGTLAVAVSSNTITLTLAGAATAWATTPTVGDTLLIPGAASDYGASAGSVVKSGDAGPAGANAGAYVVTAATTTTITARKLRNNVAGAIQAPQAKSAVAISGTPANDLLCFSPVTVKNMTGQDRGLLASGNVGVNITGTYSSSRLTITLASGSWAATPQAGDNFFIPATAPAAVKSAAGGWYTVVSATASTVVLSRLSDDRAATAFSATALAATTDLQCIRKELDGTGKTLEIQDAAGTDNISTLWYALSATPVTWISTSSTPVILRSAAERKAAMAITRNSDGVNDTLTAGGDVVIKVGYQGTTATLTVSTTGITTTVTGGSGANLSIAYQGLRTINDLVAKIGANTGYTCTIGSALFGQQPVDCLDTGTYSICSTQSVAVTGIKKDAYEFFKQLGLQSSHVQLGTGTPAQAAAGLPENQSLTFLAGGARGATTAARVVSAIDACEKIKGNFLVTCFARDAASDIADDLTDSGSTYAVDAVNAYVSTHCAKMSQLKRRRPRQGLVAKRDTFANAKLAASNIAAARCLMSFQDVKAVALDGTIQQFQPWYASALAAGMQAAGFYRGIFNKSVNCSGVVQAAGDFADSDQTALEEALEAGLNPMKARDAGGFQFVSDQTTYTVDSNFVFNSFQAIYVADVMAMTIAQRLETAFVGQSYADISAALVLSYLKGIIADLRRLKLVTSSDDAPEGYRDAVVQISGPAMSVSLKLVEATLNYFIPVNLFIQQVSQTAQG